MSRRLRSRLTYANVMSSLAFFLALGGGAAYAANTIGSSDVIDESLVSQDIKNREVKNPDLGNNAVGTNQVFPDSLTGADVKDGSLAGADLANESVTAGKISAGAVGQSQIAANGVAGSEIVNSSVRADDINVNSVGASEIAPDSVGIGDLKGVRLVNREIEDVTVNEVVGLTVPCPAGTAVIAGGGDGRGFFDLHESNRDGNGWFAQLKNVGSATGVATVTAICLE